MNQQEKQIKLAEAVGWKWQETNDHPFGDSWRGGRWISPSGDIQSGIVGCEVPPHFNPFTDANDCNALIKHLNGLNISVQVVHGIFTDSVRFWKESEQFSNWKGDNWMHGVCELALKALDDN